MTHPSPLALFALSLVLSACGTPPKVPPASQNGQLELALASGIYRCEQGVHIQVQREIHDRVNNRVKIRWSGNYYGLERDLSYSGLPRFEDTSSGLQWIDLPSKGMLLDGKTNKPLANECRPI